MRRFSITKPTAILIWLATTSCEQHPTSTVSEHELLCREATRVRASVADVTLRREELIRRTACREVDLIVIKLADWRPCSTELVDFIASPSPTALGIGSTYQGIFGTQPSAQCVDLATLLSEDQRSDDEP